MLKIALPNSLGAERSGFVSLSWRFESFQKAKMVQFSIAFPAFSAFVSVAAEPEQQSDFAQRMCAQTAPACHIAPRGPAPYCPRP